MRNRTYGHKILDKVLMWLLLSSLFFCSNIFARDFNAVIKNDTDKTLKMSKTIKNYSSFDEDHQIENMGKLGPVQKTIRFPVRIYELDCLEEISKGTDALDGFYFADDMNNKIGVVWGEIPDTGFTPVFGPLSQKNEPFKVEITKEGISQDPIYVFTIIDSSSKL